jgi:hypothetical protein
MIERCRLEVMHSVWPWREGDPAISPRKPMGRTSALVGLLVGWSVAAWLYHRGHPWAAAIIALLAATMGAGLLLPASAERLHGLLHAMAHGVGLALTWLLLLAFFYGVITPLRAWRALVGKDPLARRLDRQADSYWTAHSPGEPSEHLRRQF